MKRVKIAVIGGDKRLFYCAETLYNEGYETALYGFDKISDRAFSTRCPSLEDTLANAGVILLPLPVSKDGINVNSAGSETISLASIFEKTSPETPIFAGFVDEKVKKLADSFGHGIIDYYLEERLTLENAFVTAEGAIYLAMKHSETAIRGTKALVTGYGRIAKYLAKLLSSFGAKTDVFARSSSARTLAELDGFSAYDIKTLPERINGYDFIFNTVPAQIFDESVLKNARSSQLYIELASAPFGADKSICARYNIEIIDGGALPSKYSPKSAGEFIAREISEQLERMGIVC